MEYCFRVALAHDNCLEVRSTHISGSAISNDIAYFKTVTAGDRVLVYSWSVRKDSFPFATYDVTYFISMCFPLVVCTSIDDLSTGSIVSI